MHGCKSAPLGIGWPLSRQSAKPLTANSRPDVSASGPVGAIRNGPAIIFSSDGEPVPRDTTAPSDRQPGKVRRCGFVVGGGPRRERIRVDRQHGADSSRARLAGNPGRLPVGLRLAFHPIPAPRRGVAAVRAARHSIRARGPPVSAADPSGCERTESPGAIRVPAPNRRRPPGPAASAGERSAPQGPTARCEGHADTGLRLRLFIDRIDRRKCTRLCLGLRLFRRSPRSLSASGLPAQTHRGPRLLSRRRGPRSRPARPASRPIPSRPARSASDRRRSLDSDRRRCDTVATSVRRI